MEPYSRVRPYSTWVVAGSLVFQPMSMWVIEISRILISLMTGGVVSAVVEGVDVAVGLGPGVGVGEEVGVGVPVGVEVAMGAGVEVAIGVGVGAPHPPRSRAIAIMAVAKTFTQGL
jgi:hypothetical protein